MSCDRFGIRGAAAPYPTLPCVPFYQMVIVLGVPIFGWLICLLSIVFACVVCLFSIDSLCKHCIPLKYCNPTKVYFYFVIGIERADECEWCTTPPFPFSFPMFLSNFPSITGNLTDSDRTLGLSRTCSPLHMWRV